MPSGFGWALLAPITWPLASAVAMSALMPSLRTHTLCAAARRKLRVVIIPSPHACSLMCNSVINELKVELLGSSLTHCYDQLMFSRLLWGRALQP